MTLDDRIQKDLTELCHGGDNQGEIQYASSLEGLIQAKSGQTSFATRAMPGYYFGGRKAKTVMVMLNPGLDVDEANNNLRCEIFKRSMKNAADIKNYHKWCIEYGHKDKKRQDNFDLKQAFFLHQWKDTGITIPLDLSADANRQTLLDAKEAVLTQKLQLELIPYASSSFSHFNMEKIGLVFPFIETLFDEIFSHERNYVIFCSRIFEPVLKEYEKEHKGTVCFQGTYKQRIKDSKITGSCTVIRIHYQDKSLDAIIANTFPHQALPNAYDLMEEYGSFCYKQYCSQKQTSTLCDATG